ncbi:MAG: YdcF family protein [Oscillospiraceae bacterium]
MDHSLWLLVLVLALLGAAFGSVFILRKTSLWCGFLFLSTLAALGGTLFVLAYYFNITPLFFVLLALLVFLFILLAVSVYILIFLLFWNAKIILKRERRSLANSLTLLLALALTLLLLVSFGLSLAGRLPLWVVAIQNAAAVVVFYFVLHALLFVTTLLLCGLARPPKKQDYIIVLGSGLVHGQVSPLLAGRINKAIAFYGKQKVLRKPPKLVLSGGQGADEPLPEAEAMAAYAAAQGLPPKDLLLEGASANTLQNMQFSRRVIEQDAAGRPYRCIFATSNYHLLRAGAYARKAGLKAEGIGAKTAGYYWPTAVLREYIAHLKIHLRFHLAAAVLASLLGIFGAILPTLLQG